MHVRKRQIGFGGGIGQAVEDKGKAKQGGAAYPARKGGTRPGLRRFGVVNDGGDEGGQAVAGMWWGFHVSGINGLLDLWITGDWNDGMMEQWRKQKAES